MNEKSFHDKVKALFPQAMALSTSCSIQTRVDGTEFASWTCTAYATPIGTGSIKIGYANEYSEEEALAAIVKDAERFAVVPKCGCCGHLVSDPLDMVALANNILGAAKAA